MDVPAQISRIKALNNSSNVFEAGRAKPKWCRGCGVDVGCYIASQYVT